MCIYICKHIDYHIYVTNMTQHCVLPGKSDPTQTHPFLRILQVNRELLMSAFKTPSVFLVVFAQTAVWYAGSPLCEYAPVSCINHPIVCLGLYSIRDHRFLQINIFRRKPMGFHIYVGASKVVNVEFLHVSVRCIEELIRFLQALDPWIPDFRTIAEPTQRWFPREGRHLPWQKGPKKAGTWDGFGWIFRIDHILMGAMVFVF